MSHVSWSWLKSWKRSEEKDKESNEHTAERLANLLTCVLSSWYLKLSDWHMADRPWCKHASCKDTRGQNWELPLLYLQIPEGVTLCPCISFSLPSRVYLGAHFHATSAKNPQMLAEKREADSNSAFPAHQCHRAKAMFNVGEHFGQKWSRRNDVLMRREWEPAAATVSRKSGICQLWSLKKASVWRIPQEKPADKHAETRRWLRVSLSGFRCSLERSEN